MERKKLGNTDLELTRVGLGTWAIGGSWQFGWGPQDDEDSISTILEAIDAGIEGHEKRLRNDSCKRLFPATPGSHGEQLPPDFFRR